MTGFRVLGGTAQGPTLSMTEGISFWGGVDPVAARVIDEHHPAFGAELDGRVVMMPTSRGSCSGSGVILDMLLNGCAPAALIFSEPEDVATLGALIGAELFGKPMPVLRVDRADLDRLALADHVRIDTDRITAEGIEIPLADPTGPTLTLTAEDEAILAGRDGQAAALAMRILCATARLQGAAALTDVTRGHIDGCLLANQANLIFAEKMAAMGARVRIPATINAISVDRLNWQTQGVPPDFGKQASRLADAYVAMGCRPTFTCAPYLLDDAPALRESVGWAESNAVIYANSVLGARTPKHPDYLDLCIAMTGRAPLAGVYLDQNRHARRVLRVADLPGADDGLWPLLGWLSGVRAPDRVPLIRGAGGASRDDLRALCAAFGTTSAAPMLHVEGLTPEADLIAPDADLHSITRADLAAAWRTLNDAPDAVDLVAIGSPHASASECRALADALDAALNGRAPLIPVIVTAGRAVIASLGDLADRLTALGVQIIPDLCWCSITEPVFPPSARVVMTNSGKYAHYGPGLSGRRFRFGSMADCAKAAATGRAPDLPDWLKD